MKNNSPKQAFTPPTLLDPYRWRGKRIGLFGGSFNPPHAGHLHISRLALRKLELDFVWWLVTPHNPLKDKGIISPYEDRFAAVEQMLAPFPHQMPTHLERDLGRPYTYETVKELKRHFPNTDFVWICGMDNAHIFHKWDRWRDLIREISIVFIARPPAHSLIKRVPVRLNTRYKQLFIASKRKLDLKTPSVNWMMAEKMIDISSTKLRKNKGL